MAETHLPLQSPIDLDESTAITLSIPAVKYTLAWETLQPGTYDPVKVQINFTPNPIVGMSVTLPGNTAPTFFTLTQFHFHSDKVHHLGEHKVGGRKWPLELHVVHSATEPDPFDPGQQRTINAVLGIMFQAGKGKAKVDEFFRDLTKKHIDARAKGAGGTEVTIPLDPRLLLPENSQGHYRYEGSLTTKIEEPNAGYVSWVVLTGYTEVTAGVLRGYQDVLGHESKPLQPLDQRYVFFCPPDQGNEVV
jgi:carbonic anhydrase